MMSQDAPSATSLAGLLPEILHVVGSFLEEKDARALRLTCTRIGDVANCYAFQQLIFYLHQGDFDMLQHFANHAIFSKYVRSLTYVTDVLPQRRMSLKKFVAHKTRRDDFWYGHNQARVSPEGRSRPGLPLERPNYSDRGFDTVYHKYLQAHDWQTDMLANARDFAFFRDVLPQFTGLRNIMISAGLWYRECRWARQPFDALFIQAQDELEPKACRHAASLLLPLVGQQPILQSLLLGFVHWNFAQQLEDSSRLSQLVHICRNLTNFDIMIDTGMNDDNEAGIWVTECKETVRKGHIRSLLESMPKLVSLKVGFTFTNEEDDLYPASFRDLVSESTHWQHLQDVTFDTIEAPRQELVDFFSRHSSTLRTIELGNLRLISSSWHFFLPQLRKMADDMFLDDILLVGFVQGESEDEDTPPDIREERFDLGSTDDPCHTSLFADITDYIIWGEGPSPLDPYAN